MICVTRLTFSGKMHKPCLLEHHNIPDHLGCHQHLEIPWSAEPRSIVISDLIVDNKTGHKAIHEIIEPLSEVVHINDLSSGRLKGEYSS